MCSSKCLTVKPFYQLASQATSVLESLCHEDTWQYIDKDNRMALMRLLADLVAGMSAACEVEPEQECDTA